MRAHCCSGSAPTAHGGGGCCAVLENTAPLSVSVPIPRPTAPSRSQETNQTVRCLPHPRSLLLTALRLILLDLVKAMQNNWCGSAAELSIMMPFTKTLCNLKHIRIQKASQLLEIYSGQNKTQHRTAVASESDKCRETHTETLPTGVSPMLLFFLKKKKKTKNRRSFPTPDPLLYFCWTLAATL